jgi:YfiR/HmsC-like
MNFIEKIRARFSPGVESFATILRSRGILFLTMLWLVGTAHAQENGPLEYQVKAAFLYNFGKFVEWPTNAFADANAPLVIGIIGDDPFHGDLRRIVADKKINGHDVMVRFIATTADVKGCHIVFISADAPAASADLLAALRRPGILTVTENAGHFASSDFAINFMREENKIRFEINDQVAAKAGLKISSKLLALAEPAEK